MVLLIEKTNIIAKMKKKKKQSTDQKHDQEYKYIYKQKQPACYETCI